MSDAVRREDRLFAITLSHIIIGSIIASFYSSVIFTNCHLFDRYGHTSFITKGICTTIIVYTIIFYVSFLRAIKTDPGRIPHDSIWKYNPPQSDMIERIDGQYLRYCET